jgi:hypothetical protein
MKGCTGGYKFNQNEIPATEEACPGIIAAFSSFFPGAPIKVDCSAVEIDDKGKPMQEQPDDSDDMFDDWGFIGTTTYDQQQQQQ